MKPHEQCMNNSRVWTTFGHKGIVADLHTVKISR